MILYNIEAISEHNIHEVFFKLPLQSNNEVTANKWGSKSSFPAPTFRKSPKDATPQKAVKNPRV